ncbi:uncharacterized protein LOC129899850 [Solanum dulcamara]|uniref:uncharacterized protein LOC129899850 n=1 Tax=Solanum dulcamara TaxID=45834 RepID=UPI0024852B30|nr:uncharacterized protein LOC129899850 [Solanum dulcamara]
MGLVEKYRKRKRDLHRAFFDLKKAYDKVLREIRRGLEAKGVLMVYIRAINDMSDGEKTRIRMVGGDSKHFFIEMWLHQGSILSLFQFSLGIDELMRSIQEKVPWCILFTDDIVFIDEIRDKVNSRLEVWRQTLEFKAFKLSRCKMEYLECKFSDELDETDVEVSVPHRLFPRD